MEYYPEVSTAEFDDARIKNNKNLSYREIFVICDKYSYFK